jgi:hypothetical protein
MNVQSSKQAATAGINRFAAASAPKIDMLLQGLAIVPPIATLRMKGGLASKLFLKDRCALLDQVSFVFTFSRRRFILAMGDRNRANKNKIAILVFSVTTKNFPHDMLLQ